MPRKLIVLSMLLIALPQTSFAYVDPGTGAYVIQAIVALIGAAVFYISHPMELIRRIKSKLFRRGDEP